jgi:ketopantoate reductase
LENDMRILIYGAGVIGSIFAGKLAQKGYDITVLARNKRELCSVFPLRAANGKTV